MLSDTNYDAELLEQVSEKLDTNNAECFKWFMHIIGDALTDYDEAHYQTLKALLAAIDDASYNLMGLRKPERVADAVRRLDVHYRKLGEFISDAAIEYIRRYEEQWGVDFDEPVDTIREQEALDRQRDMRHGIIEERG